MLYRSGSSGSGSGAYYTGRAGRATKTLTFYVNYSAAMWAILAYCTGMTAHCTVLYP